MAGDLGDIGEGMGDIVTGGLAARALEPGAGEPLRRAQPGADGHTHESACLNCGTRLEGPHCHACGQRAHVHRTLSGFLHDLIHGVLHLEGKTWRTLPLLAWRPGRLTREYIDGRRASYVSPIALFLSVVFLSYALFSMVGGAEPAAGDEVVQVGGGSSASPADLDAEIARLEREAASARAGGRPAGELETELAGTRKARRLIEGFTGGSSAREAGEATTAAERDFIDAAGGVVDKVRDNPQLAIYKMQTNAYKFSWLLIPLSVPFVWLLFLFDRRFRGYDHTVFATYSIAFMIALVATASLLGYFGWGGLGLLLLCYAPVHMYRQLRGTYGVGRFGALWRLLALSLFSWWALAMFIVVLGWMAL